MVTRNCYECSSSKSLVERDKCEQKRVRHGRSVTSYYKTRGPYCPLSRVFNPFTFKVCPLPISVEGAH
jgi:hypothetical protein